MNELGRIPMFVESFQLPSLISPPPASSGAAFNNNDGNDDTDGNWWEVLPGVINAGANVLGVLMQNGQTGETEFVQTGTSANYQEEDNSNLILIAIAAAAVVAFFIFKK
tara:strand:- start:226 stop:552 length:327 start_codon:yes stop_codon:yes gene_type:complete